MCSDTGSQGYHVRVLPGHTRTARNVSSVPFHWKQANFGADGLIDTYGRPRDRMVGCTEPSNVLGVFHVLILRRFHHVALHSTQGCRALVDGRH